MAVNTTDVEAIVRQVLASMEGGVAPAVAARPAAAGSIPKTARVAVLTAKKHFDIKEYPIPEIGAISD